MKSSDFDLVVIGGGIVGAAIAAGAVRRGARVAVLERGGPNLRKQMVALPPLRFIRRRHLGSERARNHVLGGNGHYWGGGLMRPPSLRLSDVLGSHESVAETILDQYFAAVEKRYGLPEAFAREPVIDVGDDNFVAAEIAVLPSRKRNVACAELDSVRTDTKFQIIHSATLLGFEVDRRAGQPGRVRAVAVALPGGEERRLAARKYVLATGTVDCNLIVQQFADVLLDGIGPSMLGRRLHDHWSVPLARIRLGNDQALRAFLAPRLRRDVIIGRHFEARSRSGWGARGFIHFTFAFDEVSPYREIKRVMLMRQQRAGISSLVASALPILQHIPEMLRIGAERWWRRRLFLAKDLPVVATLDFEAFPHPANALRWMGGDSAALLSWDISDEDDRSFVDLAGQGRQFLAALKQRYQLSVEVLDMDLGGSASIARFHQVATDAFHLGGGLAAGAGASHAVNFDLRLRGTENLYVISSAVLNRPGVVNPTHTLLALAERFLQTQLKNGDSSNGKR